MPCYHPIPAWYGKGKTVNGKVEIVFSPVDGVNERRRLEIPCGGCVGCKLERARQWAMRCVHESKLWSDNCFVTLTYRDDAVPKDGSLRPRDFVLFMKRLRKRVGAGVRFFQCGEYGDVTKRPHHHVLLFNFRPNDLVFCKVSKGGDRLYTSRVLEELWGYGFCWIGNVTFQSAGYIARYTLKKLTGLAAVSYYNGRVPEYLTMSRRPGIGHDWAIRYLSDFYCRDSVIVGGSPSKPPKYYDSLCEKREPEVLRRVKRLRREAAAESPDNSGARLIVREAVKRSAVSSLSRVGD